MSVTVLLDVLGRHLNDRAFAPKALDKIVKEGRDLSHERRRAGGPRRKG